MIFYLVCNNVLMRLAGENGVAVFDLVQNTSYLILFLYEGTARAMQPLVSTYEEEHNIIGKKTIRKIGRLTGFLSGGTVAALVLINPGLICVLFGITETVTIEIALHALRIFALSSFCAGMNIITAYYYQSRGQEGAAFFIETARGAAFLLPFTALFSFIGNVKFFWLLYPATEICSAIAFLFIRKKFKESDFEPSRVFQKTVNGNVSDISDVSQEVSEFCESWDGDVRQQYVLTLAIEEIAMAILKHGLPGRKDGYIQITVLAFDDSSFEIHIRDNAVTFDPFSLEKDENIDADSDFSAVGVDIIRKEAKSFYYRRYQGFNSLIIRL